jgi:hypothetical protein
MTAPDELFGRKVKCRNCAAPVAIPDPADGDGFDVVDDGRPAPKPARPLPSSDDVLRPKPKKKPANEDEHSVLRVILLASGLGVVVVAAVATGLFLYLRKPAQSAPAMADVPPPGAAPTPEKPPGKPQTTWVRFDEQGAPFTIEFPNGKPVMEDAPQVSSDILKANLQAVKLTGLTATVRGWIREDGGRKYSVVVGEVGTKNIPQLDTINDILKDLPEGKIPEPTSVLPDQPATEVVTRPAPKKVAVVRSQILKGVMFEFRVEGPSDVSFEDEHVRRFLDSFKERVPAPPVPKK